MKKITVVATFIFVASLTSSSTYCCLKDLTMKKSASVGSLPNMNKQQNPKNFDTTVNRVAMIAAHVNPSSQPTEISNQNYAEQKYAADFPGANYVPGS